MPDASCKLRPFDLDCRRAHSVERPLLAGKYLVRWRLAESEPREAGANATFKERVGNESAALFGPKPLSPRFGS